MRIIQVCPRYFPHVGGVEQHVKHLSERLVQSGHEVEVLTTDPSGDLPEEDVIDGVTVKRYPVFAPQDTIYFSRPLYQALKHVEGDIVHAHDYQAWPMLAAALSASSNQARFIVTLHLSFSKIGQWVYSLYNPIFGRYIFNRASNLIIVSSATLSTLPLLALYKEFVEYIPNGVDVGRIDHDCAGYQREGNDAVLNVLSVSRLEKQKGVHFFIKALEQMNNAHAYRIVGEGPYGPTLRKSISSDNVQLLGKVDEQELRKLYTQSDIFILLSDYESHSLSLTEAMAYGLVPIVTDVGGNSDIVSHGENGFLVKHPPDVNELVETFTQLNEDKTLIKRMSFNAQKTVRERFSLNRNYEAITRLYDLC
jgi:glycosyltransferase involved in cell wall biosynthesis